MERRSSKSVDRQNVVRSCWIGAGAEEKGREWEQYFPNQARELASELATVDPKSHGKTHKSFNTLKQLSVSGLPCSGATAVGY